MIRKCPHSVYVPNDIEGDESPYCSFCKSGQRMLRLWDQDEKEADEVKTVACPICSSKEFQYQSEESYSCPNCGYCQDDII